MSKKRKSPKRRPINQPRQQEIKQSEPQSKTRRNVLIALGTAGAATLAWRAGLFDVFDDEEEESRQEQEGKKEVSEAAELTGYEKWASKINLPEVELLDEPSNLPEPKISKEKLDIFVFNYATALQMFQSDFDKCNSDEERMIVLVDFTTILFAFYYQSIGKKLKKENLSYDSRESQETMLQINSFLAQKGHCFDHNVERSEGGNPLDANIRLSIFKVKDIKTLQIDEGDKAYRVPVVEIGDQKDYCSKEEKNTNDPSVFNGIYNQEAGVIFHHIDGTNATTLHNIKVFEERNAKMGNKLRPKDAIRLQKDGLELVRQHEGLHCWLFRKGFELSEKPGADIKDKGEIDMGSYVIPPQEYLGQYNTHIHELAAWGYCLMKGGEASQVYIPSLMQKDPKTYAFTMRILMSEIFNIIPQEYRKLLVKPDPNNNAQEILDIDIYTLMISRMSSDELHKIGERMAKLGIYLALE